MAASDFNTAVQFFEGQGWTPSQSQGIAAGLFAESGLNPSAVNPRSGATGIAQWLGSRLSGLFGSGNSNTLQGQLQYVQQELTVPGLDAGAYAAGQEIAGQNDPSQTLSTFITQFERPAAGSETSGDISRGTAILNSQGGSADNSALGSSLTIDPNGASEFDTGDASMFDSNSLMGAPGSTGTNYGYPAIAGGTGLMNPSSIPTAQTAGTPTATSTGLLISGQPVDITNLDTLNKAVTQAGSSIQSGAQNAATGVSGTLASTINSIERYTNEAFIITALVVLGLIMVAYGLGIFKSMKIPITI